MNSCVGLSLAKLCVYSRISHINNKFLVRHKAYQRCGRGHLPTLYGVNSPPFLLVAISVSDVGVEVGFGGWAGSDDEGVVGTKVGVGVGDSLLSLDGLELVGGSLEGGVP